jgi:hypothetical protein
MVECQFEGCEEKAGYGYKYMKFIFCKIHKAKDMICVIYELCKCDKKKRVAFGFEGDNKASCCNSCKKDGMVKIIGTKCDCGNKPRFGFEADNIKVCCKKCQKPGMINLENTKKCKCGKSQPNFGLETDTIATCCGICKDPNMINIYKKLCPCGRSKSFGFKDELPTCCSECKKDGMILTYKKKCPCGTEPSYGYTEDNLRICCAKCKKDDMKFLGHRLCICGKQPSFGLITDTISTCCAVCKSPDMVMLSHKLCICGTQPCFGLITDDVATCCDDCKTENMVNIRSLKCIATDQNGEKYCNTRANPKYDNHCAHCFANLFPLDPRTAEIRLKTKEIAVRNFINEHFDGFSHDQPLWLGSCDCTHKRRIDHRKLINGTLMAVGTDEFQHKKYNKHDEEIRYDDLMMIHGGMFIYIRFNPDSYRENGVLKNPPIEERLEALKKEIEKQIKRIKNDENTELMEIIYMYYDC